MAILAANVRPVAPVVLAGVTGRRPGDKDLRMSTRSRARRIPAATEVDPSPPVGRSLRLAMILYPAGPWHAPTTAVALKDYCRRLSRSVHRLWNPLGGLNHQRDETGLARPRPEIDILRGHAAGVAGIHPAPPLPESGEPLTGDDARQVIARVARWCEANGGGPDDPIQELITGIAEVGQMMDRLNLWCRLDSANDGEANDKCCRGTHQISEACSTWQYWITDCLMEEVLAAAGRANHPYETIKTDVGSCFQLFQDAMTWTPGRPGRPGWDESQVNLTGWEIAAGALTLRLRACRAWVMGRLTNGRGDGVAVGQTAIRRPKSRRQNEARDKWIYDLRHKGEKDTAIVTQLQRKINEQPVGKKWAKVTTKQRIQQIGNKYADDHDKPRPPKRRDG